MVCTIKELEDGMKELYENGMMSKKEYANFRKNLNEVMNEKPTHLKQGKSK